MESLLLCGAAFTLVFFCTRRSLAVGINAAIAIGYLYGIIRANVPQTASHFIFDAGVGGLYLGIMWRGLTTMQRLRIRRVRGWVICLIAWPLILFFIPIQDPLIQLVGLRGAVWFVPFVLLGAMVDDGERSQLAVGLAILNLVALAFALGEFTLGLPRFFPYNNVTVLLYQQNDVVAGARDLYRIPSTFPSQAGYSATMVLAMPLLVGAWAQSTSKRIKLLLTAGLVAGLLGVFLGASRSQALLMFAQGATIASFARIRMKHLFAFAAIALVVGYWVYKEPRLQRFTKLDTNFVENRVSASVNESFIDALFQYPLGNGLGGGGTSIPYFLQDRLQNPTWIENEYGRLLLELGLPGLGLWVAFIFASIFLTPGDRSGPWRGGWRVAKVTCAATFGTAFIGVGLLTSIPGTALLLFMTGWMWGPKLKQFRVRASTLASEPAAAAG